MTITPSSPSGCGAGCDPIRFDRRPEMTIPTPSPYDSLIPQVSAAESTMRLQMILGTVLPADMHKLALHIICRAEEFGIERGKNMRMRR